MALGYLEQGKLAKASDQDDMLLWTGVSPPWRGIIRNDGTHKRLGTYLASQLHLQILDQK